MSKIPEDIKQLAQRMDAEFWEQDVPSGTEDTVSYFIAKAVWSERERCAAIAQSMALAGDDWAKDQFDEGFNAAASRIAQTILADAGDNG